MTLFTFHISHLGVQDICKEQKKKNVFIHLSMFYGFFIMASVFKRKCREFLFEMKHK